MQLRKDKKGLDLQLDKVVIGLIIGILCAIPLFYLGSSLMSIFFSNQQEILQAQGTLGSLYDLVEPSPVGDSINPPFLLLAPTGWWLIGFDKETKTYVGMFNREAKPSKECEGKICACICKNSADCTKNSACKEFSKPLFASHDNIAIQIKKYGTQINITNKNRFYEVEETVNG